MNLKWYKECTLLLLCSVFLWTGCSEDEVEPGFTLEEGTDSVTLAADAYSASTIAFSSLREWTAEVDKEWLAVSPAEGETGTHILRLKTLQANDTKEVRTAILTLTSVNLRQQIVVSQEPMEFLQLEKDTFYVEAEGDILCIPFVTNINPDELAVYTLADYSWLQPYNTRVAVEEYEVMLQAMPNKGWRERKAPVSFCRIIDDKHEEELATAIIVQRGAEGSAGSTEYGFDKAVRVMQKATRGKGIPVVMMGDGFTEPEILNGDYDAVMDKAMAHLFSEEPMTSLRDYFDVYAVTAVSKDNQFGETFNTVFDCELEGGSSTAISGDDQAVMDYVQEVEGIDLMNTLAVVILNTSDYAGTTYFGYSDDDNKPTEFSIAYCPVIYDLENEMFRRVLVHEAVGHGFTKLEDEYSYEDEENKRIPQSEIEMIRYMQTLDWGMNVDFTTDPEKVLWADFLNDERYAGEELGIYEGACTYMHGVYRSSEESMMNNNINGFNAPSRRAIYEAVMRLGESRQASYEEFVEFDKRSSSRSYSSPTRHELPSPRFARPRFMNGERVVRP